MQSLSDEPKAEKPNNQEILVIDHMLSTEPALLYLKCDILKSVKLLSHIMCSLIS